jgi:hypothetical protein
MESPLSAPLGLNDEAIDISHNQGHSTPSNLSRSLSELYGTLASNSQLTVEELQGAIANKCLIDSQRKYFDSGDYALLKSKGSSTIAIPIVGTLHPRPESIPQKSPQGSLGKCYKSSPVKDRVISADNLNQVEIMEALSLLNDPWMETNNNQD